MALPPNWVVSASGGSLTSITSVFPATSAPLKSSQFNSGASTPYPTQTSSDRASRASSATSLVPAPRRAGDATVERAGGEHPNMSHERGGIDCDQRSFGDLLGPGSRATGDRE